MDTLAKLFRYEENEQNSNRIPKTSNVAFRLRSGSPTAVLAFFLYPPRLFPVPFGRYLWASKACLRVKSS